VHFGLEVPVIYHPRRQVVADQEDVVPFFNRHWRFRRNTPGDEQRNAKHAEDLTKGFDSWCTSKGRVKHGNLFRMGIIKLAVGYNTKY
jgi:hypothetical protein